jgi:SAM-dependent methyltransferase
MTHEILLSAFVTPPNVVDEQDNRLLVQGKVDIADSYTQVSWDRYFADLSQGSFRDYVGKGENERVWRSRAWHFVFKNANFVQRLFARPEARILDLGCSSGFLRRMIEGNASPADANKFFYWGVDVRAENLKRALRSPGDLEWGGDGAFMPSLFLQHDLKYPLPFKSGFFDLVVNFEMIKYLPIEQGAALLAESRRVVKDEGTLYLSTTDYAELAHQGLENFMRSLPPDAVAKMVEDAGFSVAERFGSQVRFSKLAQGLNEDQRRLANALLRVHPPELVAAILGPLFPQLADQVTFRAVPKPASSGQKGA